MIRSSRAPTPSTRPRRVALATLLATAAVALALAPPVAAQLVKRGGSAAPVAQASLADELAAAVRDGLSKPAKADLLDAGVPSALVAIFANTYESSPDNRDRVVGRYRGYQQTFDRRWAEVERHGGAVAAAVTAARKLAKAQKFAEARAALEAVLTSSTVDDQGEIPARTDILLAMDVELPALAELAAIARAAGDPFVLPDIAAALWPRRRLLPNAPSEALLWMAYNARLARQREEGNALGSFSAGMPAAIGRALRRVEDTMSFMFEKDGMLLAQGFFHQLPSYGLASGDVNKQASVKLGAYGLFELSSGPGTTVTVGAKKVAYRVKLRQSLRVRCKESDKIDGYDPISKKFSYRLSCDTEDRFVDIELDAALRAAPPAWATAGSRVWVIGKVKKAVVKDDGKTLRARWTLDGAEVVDFRFLGNMTLIDFGDAAATMF